MAQTSTIKAALEISEAIRNENLEGKTRIPSTDTHLRGWASTYNRTEEEIRAILEQLKEAHYIFLIRTVAPDPNLFVYGEDAFIYADFSIINEVKKFAEDQLEKLYEATQYKRKSAFQITRELFPKVKDYNNTPLGRQINICVMLDEYSRLVNASSFEFTDQWRRTKIQDLFKDDNSSSKDMAATFQTTKEEIQSLSPEATSGDKLKERQDPQWQKITQSFPIDFLLKIHFKKYEFDVIKKMIQLGRVKEEKYLKQIRDTLQIMEKNMDHDRILKIYKEEITDLRRYSQAKLNMLRQGILK